MLIIFLWHNSHNRAPKFLVTVAMPTAASYAFPAMTTAKPPLDSGN
ncbi:hypothetical protein [Nostoc sp. ATCC 53789]|nr:hypothetical protein [Nostoc sp. ATCC 53789]